MKEEDKFKLALLEMVDDAMKRIEKTLEALNYNDFDRYKIDWDYSKAKDDLKKLRIMKDNI